MALNDLILKAKINMALVRDPRVRAMEVGVGVTDGNVTLTGDLDGASECAAAEAIARSVEGVKSVTSALTCGLHRTAETAELLLLRLFEKLDEEWRNLPDQDALTQAEYLRWALWLVYKFSLPTPVGTPQQGEIDRHAVDQALSRLADYVGASKAILALEMQREIGVGEIHAGREKSVSAPVSA